MWCGKSHPTNHHHKNPSLVVWHRSSSPGGASIHSTHSPGAARTLARSSSSADGFGGAMPGTAEYVEILLAVGTDLIERLHAIRKELQAVELANMFLSDRVAKRFTDNFPQLNMIREKDQGYDTFLSNAHVILIFAQSLDAGLFMRSAFASSSSNC